MHGFPLESCLPSARAIPTVTSLFVCIDRSQQLIVVGYMTTMNMALRYVATSEDLVLIDWEAIALMLPAAHLYVGDGTHPIGDLSAIVIMNLLLNEYERHSGGTATL